MRVNDARWYAERQDMFRAEFPPPSLRMPPPAPWFDLLAERHRVDGERHVDELVFVRVVRSRSCSPFSKSHHNCDVSRGSF